MPAIYKRLIAGLLVFLGLMLLVGRFPPKLDAPAGASSPSAPSASSSDPSSTSALTGRKSVTSRYASLQEQGCNKAEVLSDIAWLDDIKRGFESDISFSSSTDPYSLSRLINRQDSLRERQLPKCLARARAELISASDSAQNVLRSALERDINSFDMQEEMRRAMNPSLTDTQKELSAADAAIRDALANSSIGSAP